MADTMEVEIVHETDDNWYEVGDRYTVLRTPVSGGYGDYHPLSGNLKIGIGVGDFVEVEETKNIDQHYNFSYKLSDDEMKAGSVRLDPYFVSRAWDIGGRDGSGVIFHILKTCARFGEKNSKSREITAIYKSIKRLAELEGIDLE